MGQRKLLAKQLKQDADKTWRFIKEKVGNQNIGYYFSSRFAQRKLSKIKKSLRPERLKKEISLKNIRARIEKAKQDYFSGIDLYYAFSPISIKRKYKSFNKHHKNFIPNIENGVKFASGVVISYTLLLSVDSLKDDFPDFKDLLSLKKDKQEHFERRIAQKEQEKTKLKIEENKKSYQSNRTKTIPLPAVLAEKLDDNVFLFPIGKEETIEESIIRRYQMLETNSSTVNSNISLQDLLEKGGVDVYDLQMAINANPSILKKITAGTTNKKLAKAADKVTKRFKPRGRCLMGAQDIFENAGFSNIISKDAQYWPPRLKGCDDNSACNAYIPLEKNGKYVIIAIDNSAYQKSKGSIENRTMREFVKQLSPGTIIITDNVIADEYRSRSYRDLKLMYGRGGRLHGHIAVIDNSHYFKSDGCEPNGPDFSRYGKIVRIPLPRDIYIPKEEVLNILRVSEISRREKDQILSQNTKQWYSMFMEGLDRT